MRFDQVVVTAAPGDATTGSAFEIRSLLRRLGPSEIFAQNIHPDLHEEVFPLHDFRRTSRGSRRPADDIIIFHGSIGAPEVFSFILGRPERIVLVYHNISPADAFLPYDPAFAGLLESGRRDVARLARRAEIALTPSHFNARELMAMGYRDVRVWPLIVDLDRMRSVVPDPQTVVDLDSLDGPMLLFVGQMLPHKRPDYLVQAFHILSTYLVPEAHLALVGAPRLESYRRRLFTYIDELNLFRLHRVGFIDDAILAAYWRRANAWVTASEHEGFLQPVLEAMGFDLPIVARSYGAVPETVGGAGIVIPAGDGPEVFAEAMAEVLTNERLRERLVALGRNRRASFSADASRAAFLQHLVDVA
ncbi:MAG TPA: glycosyltransferase [Acidimicrobiales bacterium]|jgi:L-malate glycosyltransferase|nr:glycosyltransferase [Acidimicrobiales bacterium]